MSGTMQMRYCTNLKCSEYGQPFTFVRTRETRNTWRNCPVCGLETKYLKPGEDIPPVEYVDGAGGKLIVLNGSAATTVGEKPGEGSPLLFGDTKDADVHVSCGDVKGCPLEKGTKGKPVNIPYMLYQTWTYLAWRFKTEWCAFLTGEERDDGWYVDENGMYFPNQRVSTSNVWCETVQERPCTIGSVHSHVGMSAFFSVTDEDSFNHPVELVVNKMGELDCVTRLKLRCGEFQRIHSPVSLVGTASLTTIIEDLKSKIVETVSIKSEPASNSTRFNAEGKNVRWSDEKCIHGKKITEPCKECDGASYTTSTSEPRHNSVQRTDLPAHYANAGAGRKDYVGSRMDDPDWNPPDKLVNTALKVLDRRIKYNSDHGIKERLDQLGDSTTNA